MSDLGLIVVNDYNNVPYGFSDATRHRPVRSNRSRATIRLMTQVMSALGVQVHAVLTDSGASESQLSTLANLKQYLASAIRQVPDGGLVFIYWGLNGMLAETNGVKLTGWFTADYGKARDDDTVSHLHVSDTMTIAEMRASSMITNSEMFNVLMHELVGTNKQIVFMTDPIFKNVEGDVASAPQLVQFSLYGERAACAMANGERQVHRAIYPDDAPEAPLCQNTRISIDTYTVLQLFGCNMYFLNPSPSAGYTQILGTHEVSHVVATVWRNVIRHVGAFRASPEPTFLDYANVYTGKSFLPCSWAGFFFRVLHTDDSAMCSMTMHSMKSSGLAHWSHVPFWGHRDTSTPSFLSLLRKSLSVFTEWSIGKFLDNATALGRVANPLNLLRLFKASSSNLDSVNSMTGEFTLDTRVLPLTIEEDALVAEICA